MSKGFLVAIRWAAWPLLLLAALLAPQTVAASCEPHRLPAVMAEITGTITSTTWSSVGSGVTVTNTHASPLPVFLIASFENSSSLASVRATEYHLFDGEIAVSPVMVMTATNSADRSIGTMVATAEIPAGQGRTLSLQHRRTDAVGSRGTVGTLIALPLTTSGGRTLVWQRRRQSSEFDSNNTADYAVVSGCQMTLALSERSDVYLAASVNTRRGAGTGDRVGEWRILWRARGETAWQAAGIPALDYRPSSGNQTIVGVVAIVNSLAAGEYEFALAFRRASGVGLVETRHATLFGVALSFDAGGAPASFPTFQVAGPHATSSDGYDPALSHTLNLGANENVFLGAQYVVSATGATEGQYRLALGGVSQAYPQRRYISSAADRGSGGSVWLGTAGAAGSYNAALAQRRSGTAQATQSLDGLLVGIRLTSACPAPASVVLGSFAATSAPGGMVLTWQTGSELGVAGYRLERGMAPEGPYGELAFLPATGWIEGYSYSWVDRDVQPGVRYYYRIESLGGPAGASVEVTDAMHWLYHLHLPITRHKPA